MADWFYNLVCHIGRPIFRITSTSLVLHAERIPKTGAMILASNHISPYDVPLLIAHTPRLLDFVSITEVFRKPFVGWFYAKMNAFPHDRHRPDAPTVRTIFDRLSRGRAVSLFPEGRLRRANESVLNGGSFNDSTIRMAIRAGVPIVPVVVIHSAAYQHPAAWLPLKRTRYALNYGVPISPTHEAGNRPAAEMHQALRIAFIELYQELLAAGAAPIT